MPDSNSKQYARRLRDAALDREPADARELRAEAAAGPTNERLWRRYALLESAVEVARERSPQADLRLAVLAELRVPEGRSPLGQTATSVAGRQAGRPVGGARFAVVAAAAAVLLLTVLAFSPERTPDPSTNSTNRLAGKGQGEEPAVDPQEAVADPKLETLLADATSAYVGLARETRTAFAEVAALVPEIDASVPAPLVDESGDWVPSSVRDGVDRTLDFLFEPPLDDATRT